MTALYTLNLIQEIFKFLPAEVRAAPLFAVVSCWLLAGVVSCSLACSLGLDDVLTWSLPLPQAIRALCDPILKLLTAGNAVAYVVCLDLLQGQYEAGGIRQLADSDPRLETPAASRWT